MNKRVILIVIAAAATLIISRPLSADELCTDTDGGKVYKSSGVVTIVAGDQSKTCVDSCGKGGELLQECNCDEFNKCKDYNTTKSPNDQVNCFNASMFEYKNCKDKDLGNDYICYEGRCTTKLDILKEGGGTTGPSTGNCTDSDNGDIYKMGFTTYTQDGVQVPTPIPDYCLEGYDNKLMEVTCSGGQLSTIPVQCTGKCVDGACTEEIICTDPDGNLGSFKVKFLGKTVYKFPYEYAYKSTTTAVGALSKNEYASGTDYCIGEGNKIVEFYCDENIFKSKIKDCDSFDSDVGGVDFVCKDGICCSDVKVCMDSDQKESEAIDSGLNFDEKGFVSMSSCVEEGEKFEDVCGVAVCADSQLKLAELIPDMECPADTYGGIKASDGKSGDFVKEYYCHGKSISCHAHVNMTVNAHAKMTVG